jgi:hypothetical protein
MRSYELLDEALESIGAVGPELANGNTNHAPMVVQAVCLLGRGDSAMKWLEAQSRTGSLCGNPRDSRSPSTNFDSVGYFAPGTRRGRVDHGWRGCGSPERSFDHCHADRDVHGASAVWIQHDQAQVRHRIGR